MWKNLTAAGAAFVAVMAMSGIAGAQTSPGSNSGAAGAKISSAECQALWGRLDNAKSGNVSEAQSKPFVTSFRAVDANSDGKLTQAEFESGCTKGLVSATASSGAGSGSMPKKE